MISMFLTGRVAGRVSILLSGAAAMALCAGAAHAADLRGTVTDANTGRLLEGASVRVVETGRAVVSGPGGSFTFAGLPAGDYTVTADFVGYKRVSQTLHVTDAAVAEVAFKIGAEMEVEGIVVTATRAAEADALQVKRSATSIVDAISATDVGKLPDNNAADALQRLPGVSVSIDQGEGRYVVIRGMDSNLVNVTVNGQIFPGPEGGARRVALDTFPSDIIARLEVVKAQTPDLDANAIGGTVNIVTPSAFDTPDGFVRGTARVGYNQLGEKKNYAANASFARLLGSDKQFGVVAGVSFSRRQFESDNYEGSGFRLVNGVSLPTTRVLRDYRILRERTGVFANFEWRPTDALRLYVNNTYTRYADDEQRDSTTFEYGLGTLTMTGPTSGRDSQGRGTVELRDRKVVQTLYNVSAGGEYEVGRFTLDGNVTFAQADEDTPKRIDWEFRSAAGAFPNSFDASGLFVKTDAPALFDATKYPFRRVRSRTDDVSEQSVALTGDLRYDFAARPGFLKAGFRYVDRDKSWDRTNQDYTGVTGAFLLSEISRPGATDHLGDNYNMGPVIDRQRITDFFNANKSRFLPDAASTLANSLVTDFDAAEKVSSGYAMGETTLAGVIVTAGVRVEHTKATYKSYDIQRRAGAIVGFPIKTGGADYTDVLPDVLARYNVGDNLVLRAAWTNTIGRPQLHRHRPAPRFRLRRGQPGRVPGRLQRGQSGPEALQVGELGRLGRVLPASRRHCLHGPLPQEDRQSDLQPHDQQCERGLRGPAVQPPRRQPAGERRQRRTHRRGVQLPAAVHLPAGRAPRPGDLGQRHLHRFQGQGVRPHRRPAVLQPVRPARQCGRVLRTRRLWGPPGGQPPQPGPGGGRLARLRRLCGQPHPGGPEGLLRHRPALQHLGRPAEHQQRAGADLQRPEVQHPGRGTLRPLRLGRDQREVLSVRPLRSRRCEKGGAAGPRPLVPPSEASLVSGDLPAGHEAQHQEDQEADREQEEQDLGDPGGRAGDAAEAQSARDQRDHGKDQSPFEHLAHSQKPRPSKEPWPSNARLGRSVPAQNAFVTPTKTPRRGPNCGAPTPTPDPSRMAYFLSKTLITSARRVIGPPAMPSNSCAAPRFTWV